jgi:hypothetical protein
MTADPTRTDAQAAPADAAAPAEAPVARRDTRRRVRSETVADLVLTVLLMALFAWGYLEANEWSDRAALFPHLVCGSMFVLSGLQLAVVLLRLRRELKGADTEGSDAPAHDASGHLPAGLVAEPHGNEDDVNEDDVEYVFQTAGARRWSAALGWIAAFFVLLYVAGLYITAPLFSLLYLRFAGRRTWLLSVIYAAVVGLVLYLAFEVALSIPTPPGLFLD